MIKKERIVTTVVMVLALVAGFYATDQHMAAELFKGKSFWSPSLRWDDAIPFSPGWIWVYLLYFPVCFLPVFFKELREDIGIFRRTAAGFVLQFAAALILFWAFPSQMLRPVFEPTSFSGQAVAWFYGIDAGFNLFPSLHVANVAYIACLAWKLERKALSGAVWALCCLITASTLFVKQHYLFDLPMGLAVGLLAYFTAFSERIRARSELKPEAVIVSPPLLIPEEAAAFNS